MMEKSPRMDDADFKSLPPWKSNDVKVTNYCKSALGFLSKQPNLLSSSCNDVP